MTNNYDVEMTTDDTLELDTIIEQIDNSNSITKVNKGGDHNINVIDTQTEIFDPIDSGEYELEINGQILSVNVTDPIIKPESGVAYFKCDNSNNNESIIEDKWSEYNLSITNDVSFDSTEEAYDFSGSSARAMSTNEYTRNKSISLVGKIKVYQTGTEQYQNHFGHSDDSQYLHGNDSNSVGFWKYRDGAANGYYVGRADNSDGDIISDNNTTDTYLDHCVVYDHQNSILYYYINGSEIGSQSVSMESSTYPFRIGENTGSNKVNFYAKECKVYNKALTSTEVSNLYNKGSISG